MYRFFCVCDAGINQEEKGMKTHAIFCFLQVAFFNVFLTMELQSLPKRNAIFLRKIGHCHFFFNFIDEFKRIVMAKIVNIKIIKQNIKN